MSVARRTKRSTPRFRVPDSSGATVELDFPTGSGRTCNFPIRDLSISGISFLLPEDMASIESGTEFPAVKLRFAQTTLRGDLLVMHASPLSGGRVICGSLFYPASEEDLMKLKSVVAGFEVARTLR